MKTSLGYIKYKNKFYEVFMQKDNEIIGAVDISIPKLKFSTGYAEEDIPLFMSEITDILDSFFAVKQECEKRNSYFRFRLTSSEKEKIEQKAKSQGYANTTAFVRDKILA